MTDDQQPRATPDPNWREPVTLSEAHVQPPLPRAPLEDEIRARCAQLAEFLVSKNRAYGNSAAEPVRVFSRVSPVDQLRIRMDDKLSRIARGQGIETTDETLDDTKRDLAGYLVLEAIVGKSAPWDK